MSVSLLCFSPEITVTSNVYCRWQKRKACRGCTSQEKLYLFSLSLPVWQSVFPEADI